MALTLEANLQNKAPGEWTYNDYLNLPDDGRRYEIIEGELYVTNAPSFAHQFAVTTLIRRIGDFVDNDKLGIVLTAPFEIHFSETSRPVQPDVIFIKSENLPPTDSQVFKGIPDLLVEVLSPSSIRSDRSVKFDLYEKMRVSEYWIVNPKTRSVEVYTLSGSEYALLGEFTGEEMIQSALLAGLSIATGNLFLTP